MKTLCFKAVCTVSAFLAISALSCRICSAQHGGAGGIGVPHRFHRLVQFCGQRFRSGDIFRGYGHLPVWPECRL